MLYNRGFRVGLNGSIQQITSTGTAVVKVTFTAPASNAGNVYIQHTNPNSTPPWAIPATIDADNSVYELTPGQSVVIGTENVSWYLGEKYILSHWYVKGTSGDKLRVAYVGQQWQGTPN